MKNCMTMIFAAAAALVAISPAAASGNAKRPEVAMEIATYSINTARSESSISQLLAKQGFELGKDGLGRVVIDGIEKTSDALNLFDGLPTPSEISSAQMNTVSGIPVPFSVGQNLEYVREIEVTTDEKGKEHAVQHLGHVDEGIWVSLAPTVNRGGIVNVKIKSDVTRVQFKDAAVGGHHIQLLHRQTYSLRTKAKLRADQAAVYVRYSPAKNPTLFKAGEVFVTVVKARVAK